MKQWNRLFFFLLLNIFVSACTTLTVLVLWDRTQSSILGDTLSALTFNRQNPAIAVTPTTLNTPVPAATPTPAVIVHEVQSGDTFESIAGTYNVSVDELLNENGYSKSQPLSAGDLVRVPVRFVEIDSVIGIGDLELERVVIRNLASSELSLAGWRLEDESSNVYTFPQVTIYVKGGTVSVFSEVGADTVLDLFWGNDVPVWQSGEKVTLLDSAGSVRAVYRVP